jgi:putative DNA primase/helicase
MALWPLLPADWVVITNTHGASASPTRLPMRFAAGKTVYVVGDADEAGRAGARRFAEAFAPLAGEVRLVMLPYDITPSHGKDVRDWVAEGHGSDDWQRLLETAERVESPADPAAGQAEAQDPQPARRRKKRRPRAGSNDGGLFEALNDPHRLARTLLGSPGWGPGGHKLRYWQDDFYEWPGPAYLLLPRSDLRSRIGRAIKTILDQDYLQRQGGGGDEDPRPVPRVTAPLITDVEAALAACCLVPHTVEQPAWLDGAGPFPAREVLLARNALVHLPSLVSGRPCLLPPTPRLFSATAVDYDFDPAATCPEWLRFLDALWPQDRGSVELLWEWCGYLLLPNTNLQVILLIVGPPRSGKGTVARVLRVLLGPANVVAPPLASLQQNFGLAPLIGKSLAIVADARVSGRSDIALMVERLLSISGEDAQTIDRKYREPLTSQLPTRFMLLTNELPWLKDASGALASRMLVLRLERSWLGQEDRGLTDRLLAQAPGILNWAVAG